MTSHDPLAQNGSAPTSDPLDLLVVGGGPAGTAAAFRAQELGLSALVIDYDDLMKRIRDYAKDKQILPHFGGGDKMKFPQGGELVNRLHFDPIDKDDMCVTWKGLYETYDVPHRVGVELTEIERGADGVWDVKTWNHRAKKEQVFRARHIALAIGRGVPRRFDIPGATDGIAYKLDDATHYVGQPACVIGGGTSAAEAVIALSEAKAAAGDDCAVYWSYRGDALPKVSKALAEDFFNAYIGNGNVRYCPSSEPVAVVTTPEKEERLSIRVDRKVAQGRPSETIHLEFEKSRCVACIGEDIPEALLNSLGIYMMTGGPNAKKRMVVTPLLETQQPNVYLIGDLISQAYLETDDFNADPASFREIKHRGNIKSALRDGVFVSEVVKQKLEGRDVIQVNLTFAEEKETPSATPSTSAPAASAPPASAPAAPAAPAQKPAEAPVPRTSDPNIETQVIQALTDPNAREEEPSDPDRSTEPQEAYLVRVTAGGVEEDEFALNTHGLTTIGRQGCTISFPEDNALSENHASVSHGPEGYALRDDGSETGTFLTLHAGKDHPLRSGDLLRLGQRFLLFNAQDGDYSFVHYDHTGQPVGRHPIPEGTIVLGRQAPDITLDPGDMALSRRHLALKRSGDELWARDLNSLNGTYFRVRDAVKIDDEDSFRVGMQMLRLSLREEVKSDSTTFRLTPYNTPSKPASAPAATPSAPSVPSAPASTPAAPASSPAPESVAEPEPALADEPTALFKDLGEQVTLEPGQSLAKAAYAAGLDDRPECWCGIAGCDPVRIVAGSEHLNEVGDEEADTLQTINDLEPGNQPGQCRLACMIHPTGPVVVEKVSA